MKVLVVAVVALAVAIQALPYLPGVRGGRYGVGEGYGVGGGYGVGAGYGVGSGYGVGGGYGGGREYGQSGFNRGENGYLDQGYGSQGIHEGYDNSHQENEYDSSVHHHTSSDHNIGGISEGSRGGHLNSGYGGYNSGMDNYGRDYGHGYNYGI